MSRAEAMTALCKGTGTINGNGDYHFLLTSIDGDQAGGGGEDTLRIRIWSDSEGLIYDNQPNASEFAAPMTALSGRQHRYPSLIFSLARPDGPTTLPNHAAKLRWSESKNLFKTRN
jgi:hypothetical protein